jgi:hypothetical protein
MNRNRTAPTTITVVLTVALLGCTTGPASTSAASTGPASTSAASTSPASTGPAGPRPVTMADARHCPVTIGHPVPSSKPWREGLFGWQSAHGNGSLWVGGLWPRGIVAITPDLLDPDGRLGMKFGWYRLASGFLTITGHRLDASAPPLSGQTFPGSYGLIGFNASGVIFPTEGCWQVTGRVGRTTLTFFTFVIKSVR